MKSMHSLLDIMTLVGHHMVLLVEIELDEAKKTQKDENDATEEIVIALERLQILEEIFEGVGELADAYEYKPVPVRSIDEP